MKWILPALLFGFVGVLSAQEPDPRAVTSGEYFWDLDPGQGNGQPFTAADGTLDETVEALADSMIGLPFGPRDHTPSMSGSKRRTVPLVRSSPP